MDAFEKKLEYQKYQNTQIAAVDLVDLLSEANPQQVADKKQAQIKRPKK
jgi:hypothetical protein